MAGSVNWELMPGPDKEGGPVKAHCSSDSDVCRISNSESNSGMIGVTLSHQNDRRPL